VSDTSDSEPSSPGVELMGVMAKAVGHCGESLRCPSISAKLSASLQREQLMVRFVPVLEEEEGIVSAGGCHCIVGRRMHWVGVEDSGSAADAAALAVDMY
jgi:hypothetical protein